MGRLEGFLRGLDANGDGILHPSEIPPERRRFFSFMAERAGLDADRPVRIQQIREAMMRRYSGQNDSEEREDSGDDDEKEGKGDSDEQLPPLVPGFGVEQDLPAVPGFGVPISGASYVALNRGTSPSSRLVSTTASSSGRSSSSSDRRDVESRVREYAKGLLKRYDKNKSGVLEKDEWGQMRGDPQETDRNNDGVITLDELTVRLMEYSRRRSRSSAASGSGSSTGSDSGGERKSYRFLTPMERLPEGLPDWFAGKDANQDGQVAMNEYASFWTDSSAHEFLRYDLNNDGMITPEECLDAETREPGLDSQSQYDAPSSGGSQRRSTSWWTR